jgi:uncharacterized membrane protein HdeD (DUF308 family)
MKKRTFGVVVSPIVWSFLSIVLGTLMITYSDQIMHWVLLFCGIYLTLLGLIPIIKALLEHQPLPFASLLAAVCGVLLILFNQALAAVFFVLLGLLLFLVGLQQLNHFLIMRRQGFGLRWYHYLYPVLAIIAGVITVWDPFALPETLISFVGWCLVGHGILSLVGVLMALFSSNTLNNAVEPDTVEVEATEVESAAETQETNPSAAEVEK